MEFRVLETKLFTKNRYRGKNFDIFRDSINSRAVNVAPRVNAFYSVDLYWSGNRYLEDSGREEANKNA